MVNFWTRSPSSDDAMLEFMVNLKHQLPDWQTSPMRQDRSMRCVSALLFFLIFFHVGKRCCNAIRGSRVTSLPGFQGALPFHLETGYVGVDEGEDVQLFYYFVKSASDHPQDDPLLLWLTGGPGCSALSGFAYEIGPINFEEGENGSLPRVTLNPYSWVQVANILFLDLPVGTGFSYARTPEAASSTGLQSCHQAYLFLQKWLVDYPEYISNPFYIGGASYVGITVPVMVRMISDGNEQGIEPRINLKGYLLGNALTFPDEDNYKIPFAHGMALISDELYKSLKRNCKGKYFNRNNSNRWCQQDVQTFNRLIDGLFPAQILEPGCTFKPPRPPMLSQERRFLDERHSKHGVQALSATECRDARYRFCIRWANEASVREALHIHPGTVKYWLRCNSSLPYTDYMWDSTPHHAYLSVKGYRSLIYSGDHDMVVTFLATEAWIKSLNYPVVDEWRQWRVQYQVAGYTRTYKNNMTFATVKGGGHTAPLFKPLECLAMFKRWISYQPLYS